MGILVAVAKYLPWIGAWYLVNAFIAIILNRGLGFHTVAIAIITGIIFITFANRSKEYRSNKFS